MKNLNNTQTRQLGMPITLFFSTMKSISKIKDYQETSDALTEAVKNEKHIEIQAKNNKTYKLKKILIEKGGFYGLKKIKGKLVKTFININKISKVKINANRLNIFYNVVW
jgi:hypothetical protein